MRQSFFAVACLVSAVWGKPVRSADALRAFLKHLRPNSAFKRRGLPDSRCKPSVMELPETLEDRKVGEEVVTTNFRGKVVPTNAKSGEIKERRSPSQFVVGEEVDAIVDNIASFGVFCDIGATDLVLLHISEASESSIENLEDVYKEGQQIKVRIKNIDIENGRAELTVKSGEIKEIKALSQFVVGEEVDATVKAIAPFGVFCDIGATEDVLLHISEAGDGFIENLEDLYEEGQQIRARIIHGIGGNGRASLTVKSGEVNDKASLSHFDKIFATTFAQEAI